MDWLGIALLYIVGSVILIAELFLPAHGLLGMVGLGVLAYALLQTFMVSGAAGFIGVVALAILLPAGLVVSVKYWHRTPVGRRISPPNPELADDDRMPVEKLRPLIGRHGRSLTVLRPVGTCVFDGQRVECKAEHGMIAPDMTVEAVRLADRTVVVRAVSPSETDQADA